MGKNFIIMGNRALISLVATEVLAADSKDIGTVNNLDESSDYSSYQQLLNVFRLLILAVIAAIVINTVF